MCREFKVETARIQLGGLDSGGGRRIVGVPLPTGQGAPAGGGEESRLNITPERMFPGSSRGPLQLRFGKDSAGLQR